MLRLLLVAPLLLAAGCDELFYSGLDQSSTADLPVFDFGNHPDLSGSAKLYGFYVTGRPRDTADWRTFWDIHINDGRRYSTVDRLGYGELPADFRTVQYSDSLPAGWVFAARGGYHGIGQDCYFEITADSLGERSIRALSEDEFQCIVNPGGG